MSPLVDDSPSPTYHRPTLALLAERIAILRRLTSSAIGRGDWQTAAQAEELTALTEHQAGLLRDELERIFGRN
jgi:hypothetical protein